MAAATATDVQKAYLVISVVLLIPLVWLTGLAKTPL